MKRKLFFWAKKKINSDNIRFAILLVPIVIILIQNISIEGLDLSSLLDTDILISFILVTLSDIIARILLDFIQKKCEDSAKLTTNYSLLIEKYPLDNLIEYQGAKFPIICLCFRKKDTSWKIKINDDPESQYQLPSQIADLSDEIMGVHSKSVIYNNIKIRLNDILFNQDTGTLTLYTGRTYYFDSMVTNRAADYEFSNGKTIREIFEPGPYIKPLHQTKMSNHLGYNGFIETSDGKIPFIICGDNLSIGKGTLTDSIAASLKSEYAIEDDYRFTLNGLGNSILEEIADTYSVKRANDYFKEHGVTSNDAINSIFAVYRDLVDCGKPQFLFFMRLNFLSSEELLEKFESKKIKNDSEEDEAIHYNKKLKFFTINQLKGAKITADKLEITANRKKCSYTMMPSASAAIVMLLKYLE